MNKKIEISHTLQSTWEVLKSVREEISNALKESDQHVIDATVMTASELIENAIKYGKKTSQNEGVEFRLNIDDGCILIKVSNGIISDSDYENVKTHIEKINKSEDPARLYTMRLMELMENAEPGVSQLGLYRIAYEGEFKLDYERNKDVLIIKASRKIDD